LDGFFTAKPKEAKPAVGGAGSGKGKDAKGKGGKEDKKGVKRKVSCDSFFLSLLCGCVGGTLS
jgi:hypothetical protein